VTTKVVESTDTTALGRQPARRKSDAGTDLIVANLFESVDAVTRLSRNFPSEMGPGRRGHPGQPERARHPVQRAGGSFLLGYIFGKLTKTNTVGFVGAIDIPLIAAGSSATRKASSTPTRTPRSWKARATASTTRPRAGAGAGGSSTSHGRLHHGGGGGGATRAFSRPPKRRASSRRAWTPIKRPARPRITSRNRWSSATDVGSTRRSRISPTDRFSGGVKTYGLKRKWRRPVTSSWKAPGPCRTQLPQRSGHARTAPFFFQAVGLDAAAKLSVGEILTAS